MSWLEMATFGLAAALGATLGLLGVGLCLGVATIPIFSRMVKRLGPAMLTARRRLGLGMPAVRADA
jgi:hypothetical protein